MLKDLQPGERITLVTRHFILVCTLESIRPKEEHQPTAQGAADETTDPEEGSDCTLSVTVGESLPRSS